MKTSRKSKAANGFSLVEIMVGMVIGMLGVLVVYQVFAVSEGQKRTTTSGGDAQQQGAMALFTIERSVRMAGYGINDSGLLGCNVLAYNSNLPGAGTFNFTLAPVNIEHNADDTPDSVTGFYSSAGTLVGAAELDENMATSTQAVRVTNRYGFGLGDLVIATSPGLDCSLYEITSLPTGTQNAYINHDSGTYTNADGVSVPSLYNSAAGLGVNYPLYNTTNRAGGRLFNIGRLPVNNIFAIQNNQLTVRAGLTGAAAVPVADGIVQLKAQYGKDTNADGQVDSFDATQPTASADWAQIVAVRIAIVARSSLMEKPNATTGLCDTTTAASVNMPKWSGGTFDLSANADWQCYRYKTFETTVPLRNMIWSQ